MAVLIYTGYPLLSEACGPVELERKIVPIYTLQGKLLELAVLCTLIPDYGTIKVTFASSYTNPDSVSYLHEDGTYKEWNPLSDKSQLEKAIGHGCEDDNESTTMLKKLVSDFFGDRDFEYDVPKPASK